MSDGLRRVFGVVVPIAAVAVIVIGLAGGGSAPQDPDGRTAAIAANVRCPFCDGESVADSTSSVAADYRDLIREWIDQGVSDEEIYDRFRSRFGEAIILDAGTSGWSIVPWAAPVAVLVVGAIAIVGLRRRGRSDAQVRTEELV